MRSEPNPPTPFPKKEGGAGRRFDSPPPPCRGFCSVALTFSARRAAEPAPEGLVLVLDRGATPQEALLLAVSSQASSVRSTSDSGQEHQVPSGATGRESMGGPPPTALAQAALGRRGHQTFLAIRQARPGSKMVVGHLKGTGDPPPGAVAAQAYRVRSAPAKVRLRWCLREL